MWCKHTKPHMLAVTSTAHADSGGIEYKYTAAHAAAKCSIMQAVIRVGLFVCEGCYQKQIYMYGFGFNPLGFEMYINPHYLAGGGDAAAGAQVL